MIDFPASTIVNRIVPKEKFYSKTVLRTTLRQQFIDEIEKIRWTHKISPDTLNITSKEYPELQVFEITLKQSELSLSILKHIDTFIPYPILFILKKPYAMKAVMSYKVLSLKSEDLMIVDSYFETPWQQELTPTLDGRSVDEIYTHFLFQIAPNLSTTPHADLKSTVHANKEHEKIQRQIDMLNKKIKAEPSIAKKQKLARHRYELEQNL